jgi:acylphosphatase
MMAEQQRVEVWYSGHVQGVGFRQRTRQLAADYAVVGEVRNLSDGRVELTAEGPRSELEGFLRAIDETLGEFIRGRRVEWTRTESARTECSTANGRFTGFHVASDRLVQ